MVRGRVAVIGAGVAGLTAAHVLRRSSEVVLYEADDRPGGQYFVSHFVVPLVSAVWSCPPGTAMRYPARYLFRFLDHHGLYEGMK